MSSTNGDSRLSASVTRVIENNLKDSYYAEIRRVSGTTHCLQVARGEVGDEATADADRDSLSLPDHGPLGGI